MQTQSTVTHLLDQDWHSVIAEQLQAYPTAAALVIEPAILAQFDCEHGLPCDPVSRGYKKLADIEQYIWAYNDTTALWSQMVSNFIEDAYDREPAIEDDYEWIRMGC